MSLLSLAAARKDLCERLSDRRSEIETTALTRVQAVAEAPEGAGPAYGEALRSAVAAAITYALIAIERGEERAPPVPYELVLQARIEARNAVGLETVLRRYFAGYTLLSDFVIEEAEGAGLLKGALTHTLRTQAVIFDRLIVTLAEEYGREVRRRRRSSEERRTERVRRLLAGELVDTAELHYDFRGHHLALIGSGPGAQEVIRGLAKALDRRLLLVEAGEGEVWAWLGSHESLDPELPERHIAPDSQARLAIGEPAKGIAGCRLSHRQAKAAMPIALRGSQPLTRYADVALLASMLQDDLLATSLREIYLVPLEAERDGGRVLRETLRAYFAAERNVSSAAAALGVNRGTVASRLRVIEARIGRPLGRCIAEVDAALRLREIEGLLPGGALSRT